MKLKVQGKTSKRQVRKVLGIGCLTILIGGLAGLFSITRMVREDSAKLPSDLERLRGLGVPLNVEELHKQSLEISRAENAAMLYHEAFKAIEDLPTEIKVNLSQSKPSSAAAKEKARATLVSIRPILSLLREAGKLPHYDFDIETPTEEGSMNLLPLYINAEVSDRLVRGDLNGALDDLALFVRIARQSPEFGSVFGNEWQTRTQEAVLDRLRQIVEQHAYEGDLLDKVDQLTKKIWLPNLPKLIQTDFVRGRAVIARITSVSQFGSGQNIPAGFRTAIDSIIDSPGFRDALEARYVNTYLRLFDALPADSEDWIGIQNAIARINEQLEKDRRLDNFFAKRFAPEYNGVPAQFARALAKKRMLLLTVELLRRRKTSHRFPDKLPQLGLVSIDPATKRPFYYERKPFGFTLISEMHRFFPRNANSKIQTDSMLFDIRHTFSERANSSVHRPRSGL